MRMRIMSKRGKKFITAILTVAMLLPLVWGQTVVTEAAALTTAQAIKLECENNITMERGDEVLLKLVAAQKIDVEEIVGSLSFKNQVPSSITSCFSLANVEATGWNVGYDTSASIISLRTTSAKTVEQNAVIATIRLTALKDINTVDAVFEVSRIKAKNDGTDVDDSAPAELSCSLTNSAVTSRGVELETTSALEERIYTFSSSNSYGDLREFSIPIKIKENSGFNAMKLQITYDTQKLNYKGYKVSPKALVYLNCMTEYQGVSSGNNGIVYLSFAGTDDTKITGDFLTLTFEVARGTQAGDSVEIKPEIVELQNVSESTGLRKASNSCTVTFRAGSERGDVNQDTKIDLLDVTYVLQYYNGVRDLTVEQKALADVNNDTAVNLVDVLLILKKVNGENVTFS